MGHFILEADCEMERAEREGEVKMAMEGGAEVKSENTRRWVISG